MESLEKGNVIFKAKLVAKGDAQKEGIDYNKLEGFSVVGKENWVCKLQKSLYGLKQSPRQWYK
ncbi:unnamed protein product [Prunus armeniaca]